MRSEEAGLWMSDLLLPVMRQLDDFTEALEDPAIEHRYQHCELVRFQAAILDMELLYLPAYSPNLHLIERLSGLVKKRCLTNRYYPTFADFRQATDQCLDDLASHASDQLLSLLSLNFQFCSSPK